MERGSSPGLNPNAIGYAKLATSCVDTPLNLRDSSSAANASMQSTHTAPTKAWCSCRTFVQAVYGPTVRPPQDGRSAFACGSGNNRLHGMDTHNRDQHVAAAEFWDLRYTRIKPI